MTLIDTLASQATAQTRESGQHYYRSGAVKIEESGDWQVRATIVGRNSLVRSILSGKAARSEAAATVPTSPTIS